MCFGIEKVCFSLSYRAVKWDVPGPSHYELEWDRDGMGRKTEWDGTNIFLQWDGMGRKTEWDGMGWDEQSFAMGWDGMGRIFFDNGMGWDGTSFLKE